MSTIVREAEEFVEDIQELIDDKDEPDEWYVLVGSHVTDYSVNTADRPEELPEETEEDANPNVDGSWQIGTLGWAGEALSEDSDFVREVGFGGGNADTRLLGTLLVHESMLSEEARDQMDVEQTEAPADD